MLQSDSKCDDQIFMTFSGILEMLIMGHRKVVYILVTLQHGFPGKLFCGGFVFYDPFFYLESFWWLSYRFKLLTGLCLHLGVKILRNIIFRELTYLVVFSHSLFFFLVLNCYLSLNSNVPLIKIQCDPEVTMLLHNKLKCLHCVFTLHENNASFMGNTRHFGTVKGESQVQLPCNRWFDFLILSLQGHRF